jgi:hypothetical protein
MPKHIKVTWRNGGSHPRHPPDPTYPNGSDLDLSLGAAEACMTALPYPAPGVGVHVVDCAVCGLRVSCGASGRADDPRMVKLACRRSSPPAAA